MVREGGKRRREETEESFTSSTLTGRVVLCLLCVVLYVPCKTVNHHPTDTNYTLPTHCMTTYCVKVGAGAILSGSTTGPRTEDSTGAGREIRSMRTLSKWWAELAERVITRQMMRIMSVKARREKFWVRALGGGERMVLGEGAEESRVRG